MRYKILMTLMGLEIGGAETHVINFQKNSKKQGYDIIVASNGGVYEKELADVGIKHYDKRNKPKKCFENDKILFSVAKNCQERKSGYCPFSCQNTRVYLWQIAKKDEIYICDIGTLGFLYGNGFEIFDHLGTKKSLQ